MKGLIILIPLGIAWLGYVILQAARLEDYAREFAHQKTWKIIHSTQDPRRAAMPNEETARVRMWARDHMNGWRLIPKLLFNPWRDVRKFSGNYAKEFWAYAEYRKILTKCKR